MFSQCCTLDTGVARRHQSERGFLTEPLKRASFAVSQAFPLLGITGDSLPPEKAASLGPFARALVAAKPKRRPLAQQGPGIQTFDRTVSRFLGGERLGKPSEVPPWPLAFAARFLTVRCIWLRPS